jgi:hypothetical protein
LEFFLPPNFWLLFFFLSQAAFETLTPLLQNETRMSSSMYNQVSFLGFIFGIDIWSLAFSFRSCAASETLRPLLQNRTRISSSMYNSGTPFGDKELM